MGGKLQNILYVLSDIFSPYFGCLGVGHPLAGGVGPAVVQAVELVEGVARIDLKTNEMAKMVLTLLNTNI